MSPKPDIRNGPHLIRKQPPVVGQWCLPPSSGHVESPCAHYASTCEGDSRRCDLCGWPFCQTHYPRHTRRFECPRDIWLLFDARRRSWYERVTADPKQRPKVDVHFPEAELG